MGAGYRLESSAMLSLVGPAARVVGAVVTCVLATITIGTMPAVAQPSEPQTVLTGEAQAESSGLTDVVVTARYRAENLQQAPLAITALTGSELQARGAFTVSDIAQSIPSATLTAQGAQGGSSLVAYIRGLGQSNYSLAFQPGVPVYVDDVYQPTAFGSLLTLGDVERIDVLRGPQGTLFGKNSEGGAVTIQTVDPKGEGKGYFEASAGSYSERRFRGAYDFSLIPDKLFVRVAAGSDNSDGYVKRIDYVCEHPNDSGSLKALANTSCLLGGEGGLDETYARVAVKYLPNEDLIVRLSVSTIQNHDEATPGVPLIINPKYPGSDLASYNANVIVPAFGIPIDGRFIPTNPYETYGTFSNPLTGTTFSPYNTERSWDATGKVDWSLPYGMHFTSITGFKDINGILPDYNGGPTTLNMVQNTLFYQDYTEEDRLSGVAFDNRFEWTVGLYYFHGHGSQIGDIDVASAGIGPYFGISETLDSPTSDSNKSAFLHGVYHLTQKLSLEAGVRYSHDRFDYAYAGTNLPSTPPNALLVPGTPVFGPGQPLHVSSTDSRVDPKLALQYQWTDNFMTYAQYGTGYKGGGANPSPTNAQQATPFFQEQLKAYEVGAKSELFDRRVTINGDVYLNDVTGLQLVGYASTSVGGTVTLNAGHATIKGAELELNARPVPALLINASADYLRFQYLSLGAAAFSAQNPGGLYLNDVAPFTPKLKGNVGVQYTADFGNYGTLMPRLDYTYTSRVYFDPQNLLASSQGGFAMLNAKLAWTTADAKWTASVKVANVTNKLYYLNMLNSLRSFGFLWGEPGEPRTALASLEYSFN